MLQSSTFNHYFLLQWEKIIHYIHLRNTNTQSRNKSKIALLLLYHTQAKGCCSTKEIFSLDYFLERHISWFMDTHNILTHSCVCMQEHGHIQDMTIQRKVSILNAPILTQFPINSIKLNGIFKTKAMLQLFGKHNMSTKMSEVSTPKHCSVMLFPDYVTAIQAQPDGFFSCKYYICQSQIRILGTLHFLGCQLLCFEI